MSIAWLKILLILIETFWFFSIRNFFYITTEIAPICISPLSKHMLLFHSYDLLTDQERSVKKVSLTPFSLNSLTNVLIKRANIKSMTAPSKMQLCRLEIKPESYILF